MPPQPSAWRLKPIHLQENLIDLTEETIHLSDDTIDLSDDTIELSEEEATDVTREGKAQQNVATVKETINRVDVKSEVIHLQSGHVDESVVEVHTAEPSRAHLQEPTQETIVEHSVKEAVAEVPARTAEATPAAHRDGPAGAGAREDVVEHDPAVAATHVQEPRPERARGARGAAPPADHRTCGDRPHACSKCGKRFKQRKHMTNHERLHCNYSKPFPCATCDKRFNDTERLRRHERTHTDAPPPRAAGPFACAKCQHQFRNNYQWKRHERDRICDREHPCGSCSAVFGKRSALMMHVCRWHAPAQPYHRCESCRRPFLRLRSLLKHERSHHQHGARPYPYKCALCTRAFAALPSLEKHLERAHEQNSYQCNICQTNFADSITLEKHVLLEKCDSNTQAGERAYNCGICSAGFDCFNLFQNHARIHM